MIFNFIYFYQLKIYHIYYLKLSQGHGTLNYHSDRLKKAYFYWVTREQGSFEWFRDIMKEVSVLDSKQVSLLVL